MKKILIAASKSISEETIRRHLTDIADLSTDVVSYVDGNSLLRKVVLEIWPAASAAQISATSLISPRKPISECSHLLLLWDGDEFSNLLFEAKLHQIKIKLIPIQVTKIVNKEVTDEYDLYIGRGTPWGNPFAIGHGEGPDRTEVIEKYKAYFTEKIKNDKAFRRGITEMKGLRLACFCKPARCHGDVIADYLNSAPNLLNETQ